MKKILIAYYSRTGTTKKVAEFLAEKLGADCEEIKDTVDRSGAKGYFISGRDGTFRKLTTLRPLNKNTADYDLVVVGTPIWSWNMSAPIRTYLTEYKNEFKKVAFFATMGGSGDERTFVEMAEIVGKQPVATFALTTKEVVTNNFQPKAEEFAGELST